MMSSDENLTEEQKNFLQLLEEEFKDRYTEKDEEFKAVLERKLPGPPIIVLRDGYRHNENRRYQIRERWNRERDYHHRNRYSDNQYGERYNRDYYKDYRHDRFRGIHRNPY